MSKYDQYLEEVKELEGSLYCPKCHANELVHIGFAGYDFLCPQCGEVVEYKREEKDDE